MAAQVAAADEAQDNKKFSVLAKAEHHVTSFKLDTGYVGTRVDMLTRDGSEGAKVAVSCLPSDS